MVAAVIRGNVDITFSIDGLVGLNYAEPAPQQYIYRTNVFAKTDLSPGEHTLVIQNGRGNGEYDQVMMFLDSIIYTYVMLPPGLTLCFMICVSSIGRTIQCYLRLPQIPRRRLINQASRSQRQPLIE